MPIIANSPLFVDDDGVFTQEGIEFPYLVEQMQTFYLRDEGTLQVPVGAPWSQGQPKVPCKIVRAHAPVERKVVTFLYMRVGKLPDIPADDPINSNEVLAISQVIPLAPMPYGQGDLLKFGIWGMYVYDLYLPHDQDQDAYTMGKLAGLSSGSDLASNSFLPGLLQQAGSGDTL